eukprot:374191-Prymnesium_polylepis.1
MQTRAAAGTYGRVYFHERPIPGLTSIRGAIRAAIRAACRAACRATRAAYPRLSHSASQHAPTFRGK